MSVSWTDATSAAALASSAEALYRDYGLPAVAKWKEEHAGPAIGYMPIYVPRELLHAQGALPVGILGGGDDLEIIRGRKSALTNRDAWITYGIGCNSKVRRSWLSGKMQRVLTR